MSDKPDHRPSPAGAEFFALPDHHVLALTGPDALRFAQAQTMNDVAALADGQWQWNGWLTPKGRIVALFALLRLDAQTVWLLLPDTDPSVLAAQLQKFVFRSKLSIAVRTDLRVAGALQPPATASGAHLAGDAEAGIELDLGGEGGARTLRIGPQAAADDADALARWRALDLEHGLPRLDASQAEHWTPQQLSLEQLRAFSVKKGCYPGQEIVARTHFLGQAKRGLALLRTPAPASPGEAVLQNGAQLGSVVCAAGGPAALALAVLPLERSAEPLEIAGHAAAELPLSGGLAR
jgi:folate-binding protein YgfZ